MKYLILIACLILCKSHSTKAIDVLLNANETVHGEVSKQEQRKADTLVKDALRNAGKHSNKTQAEDITTKAEQSSKHGNLVAQNMVTQVLERQKGISLEDLGIEPDGSNKIADSKGVNIANMISRYNSKDFLENESDKLPSLMVFISLGMPVNTLKQLAEQVRKVNGVLVLKGIYKGSLPNTINAVHQLNKEGVPAIIHPQLFKKYDVKAVPAFVLENKETSTCRANKCTRFYDKLTGNVSLSHFLERVCANGSNKQVAQRFGAKMDLGVLCQ